VLDYAAITDENGIAKFENVETGVHKVRAEMESYEPWQGLVEVKSEDANSKISMNPMTIDFINRENQRLQGTIRSSVLITEIVESSRCSEHLIKLASPVLKNYATKQFEKTSKQAFKQINELRTTRDSGGLHFITEHLSFGYFKDKKKSKILPSKQ